MFELPGSRIEPGMTTKNKYSKAVFDFIFILTRRLGSDPPALPTQEVVEEVDNNPSYLSGDFAKKGKRQMEENEQAVSDDQFLLQA